MFVIRKYDASYFVLLYSIAFLRDQQVKNVRNADLIPGSGTYPRKGKDNPFQYSCLKSKDLAMQELLCFHTNLYYFSISVKNAIGIFIGISSHL